MVKTAGPLQWLTILMLMAATGGSAFATDGTVRGGTPATPAARARIVQGWGEQPIAFEANRGQTDPRVRFLSRGPGGTLFLTPTEMVLALTPARAAVPAAVEQRRATGSARVVRLSWIGADPEAHLAGEGELPGTSNYLVGSDPASWRTGVPLWSRVRHQGLYPGIDLVFYSRDGRIEHDFVVAPGADPRTIRLGIEGADRVSIEDEGDLVIDLGGGQVRLRRPFAYQEIDGVRHEVPSRYRLRRELASASPQAVFEIGAYDPSRPLVIDPVFVYSTYLGGDHWDDPQGIAVDPAGNAYVAGITFSPDFPTKGAFQATLDGFGFIAKLDPSGGLVYSTYFPEVPADVAVDAAGSAYVTGIAYRADFPQVGSPAQPVGLERPSLFVTKLAPDGASLVYSTIVVHGMGKAVAVDPAGRAHVTGAAFDPDLPGDAQPQRWDAVVAILSPDGSQVERLLRFGGSEREVGFGIELDAAGAVHVVGETDSTDFPTLRPGLPQPPDTSNLFVTKLDATGAMVYSTYLGGNSWESFFSDIAVDAGGTVYVAGWTSSSDFPGAGAPVIGGADAFVAVLDPAGSLVRSRLLGGSSHDWASAIAVDAAGRIHLAGGTYSLDFPLRDPLQSQCAPLNENNVQCFADAFVAVFGPGAEQLLFSTYLGGAEFASGYPPEDAATGIAVDAAGNVHVTGWAYSAGFPTVNAFQPSHAPVREGENDAFITKIALGLPPECASAVARPAVLWPPDGRLVPISIAGVTDPDGDPVTIRVTGIQQDEALTGAFDGAGVGTAQATVRAARAGRGDGRVYRVSFEASDASAGVCAGEVTVCVPHDRRPGAACGDGGALVDSIR